MAAAARMLQKGQTDPEKESAAVAAAVAVAVAVAVAAAAAAAGTCLGPDSTAGRTPPASMAGWSAAVEGQRREVDHPTGSPAPPTAAGGDPAAGEEPEGPGEGPEEEPEEVRFQQVADTDGRDRVSENPTERREQKTPEILVRRAAVADGWEDRAASALQHAS